MTRSLRAIVAARLAQRGPNDPTPATWKLLLAHFDDLLVSGLLGAAAVCFRLALALDAAADQAFAVEPLTPSFGALVHVDIPTILASPRAHRSLLNDAFNRHGLLLWRNQTLRVTYR